MAQGGSDVPNWPVPEWSSRAVDVSRPVTFVAVVPCRIVDTRNAPGPYGGPIIPANTVRDFDLNSGSCSGIPAGVAAYSLNFTATQTQGFGDLRVWPTGASPPLVSTLNYVPNETVANAAIVPAAADGSISVVAAVSGTHLIIDINGYFTDRPDSNNRWIFSVGAASAPAFSAGNSAFQTNNCYGIRGVTSSGGDHSFGVVGWHTLNAQGEVGGVLSLQVGMGMPPYGPSGVRGEHLSSFGVLGISEAFLGVAGSNVTGGLEQTWGALACSDTVAVCGMGALSISGTKSFVEPHPTDPSRLIKYVSLEGPEAGTYFGGRGKFVRGVARIAVPESFRMVTAEENLSIQITPIGELATVAVVKIGLDEIVVKSSRNVEFFYTVNGLRRGYEDFTPIVEESFFMPRSAQARMPGSLSAEAKRKLVANGTYKEDGTVNLETARRLGWMEKWKKAGVATKAEQGGQE
jgi:hypothetical protein